MRDALSSDAARVDPERYPRLLQRFSFVKAPTPETMAFLDSVMSTSSGVDRLAAAHSLGAAAGHLRSTGGDYAPYNAKLIDNLKNAGSPDERRAMVGSIGNVGASENIPVLAEMTKDESPDVRRAVARAMRKVDAPEAPDVVCYGYGANDVVGGVDTGEGVLRLGTMVLAPPVLALAAEPPPHHTATTGRTACAWLVGDRSPGSRAPFTGVDDGVVPDALDADSGELEALYDVFCTAPLRHAGTRLRACRDGGGRSQRSGAVGPHGVRAQPCSGRAASTTCSSLHEASRRRQLRRFCRTNLTSVS